MDAKTALTLLRIEANEQDCASLASPVLDNPKFSMWTATANPDKHHYGVGGLVVHTAEVVDLCLAANVILGQVVSSKLLYLAALWHDYGKLWDYEMAGMGDTAGWANTDHKKMVHHITRSAFEFQRAASLSGTLMSAEEDAVLHAILAHHGQPVWGSPVAPATKMAWILHTCDQMSARVYESVN